MSKKKHIILGYGTCRECNGVTETRQGTNHGKSFYFSQYDYCTKCGKVWFDEKYKILPNGTDVQRKFDTRIIKKQNRAPERSKTEQEISDQKRAYGEWRRELNEVLKKIGKSNNPSCG